MSKKDLKSTDMFIEKFKAIHGRKWYVGDFSNEKQTRFCAFGHCRSSLNKQTRLEDKLQNLFITYLRTYADEVNDGKYGWKKLGSNPKTRILNALKTIRRTIKTELNK